MHVEFNGVKASAREPTRILSKPQTQRSHVRAYLGASMMLARAASHTTEGSAATSGSTTEDLGLHSAQVLHAYWVKCHDLRAAIRARNHQGRPGRYRGEDTARVRFIDGWVMPSLLRGKLPTEHDDRMLFLGPKATLATVA